MTAAQHKVYAALPEYRAYAKAPLLLHSYSTLHHPKPNRLTLLEARLGRSAAARTAVGEHARTDSKRACA